MRRIAPHLRLATSVRIANVWLLEDGGGRRFLVDTGHVVERPVLRFSLWRAGVRRRGDLTAVLLTHRHSDHAGNAAWLRRTFDCPVICHPEDAEVLDGRRPAPKLAVGRARLHEELLCHVEDLFPARTVVDDVFEPGLWRWGFHVIPVPGHTKGSVMLHHEPTATLFAGDAILAGIPPLRLFVRPALAVPGFSDEVELCHGAARRWLAEMPPTDALCSGHGPALPRGAGERLRTLLE